MVAATRNLSRYREIETLGSGGMATVALAQDTLLGREVALKRMHTAADPHGAARLRREALVGASISHPNLVSVYDVVGTDEGDVVIVMEYVAGENLRDALARERRLPLAETFRVLGGVAAGLDAIHERGIVHRDIKPANILLGRDGAVKIADLGIASAPDHTRITTVGTVMGSFSYMAPEQLEDGAVTPAIDVYALATVAFEALSGVAAHRESTPIAVAHAIATQPAPDVRDVWPQAPDPVAELLRRGMARDPAQRPRSAGELVARLRAAFDEQPTRRATRAAAAAPAAAIPAAAVPLAASAPRRRAEPPPAPPGARRAALILVPLALVLLALGVIAAILLAGNGSSPRSSSRASHTSRPAAHRSTSHSKSTPPPTTSGTHSTSTPTQSTPSTSTTTSTPTTTSSTSTSTPAPPPGTSASPTTAVASFYELAASHRYSDAWALADPVFRSQLGGYSSFVNGQSGDRKIIFHTDRVVSQSANQATVQIVTTSVRDNGTSQCHGTVALRNEGAAGWLLHAIAISCS